MRWSEAFFSLLPVAAAKSVSPPSPSWFDVSPDMLGYGLLAALLLIILSVFSR